MPSLYDRLRRAGTEGGKARVKRGDGDCLVIAADCEVPGIAPSDMPADTVRLMTGRQPGCAIPAEGILFLDTETTGLSGGAGTVAFLVGTACFREGRLRLTQFLMRDYDEEASLLRKTAEQIAGCEALVTFNGSAFDLPLLESRFVMSRVGGELRRPAHLDLLYIARRVYGMRLKKCSLSALEEELFSLRREDDLPGAKIPERYFEYVRTRDASLLDGIVAHNGQDIVSMARLLPMLCALHERPLTARHEEELFSLGRVFEKRGEPVRAGTCYRACARPGLSGQASMRLAEIYRRRHENALAELEYRKLFRTGPLGARACIALSKIYEHRYRDAEGALALARKGMLYCRGQPPDCADLSRERADLKRRLDRLALKTGGKKDGDPGEHESPLRPAQAAEGADGRSAPGV